MITFSINTYPVAGKVGTYAVSFISLYANFQSKSSTLLNQGSIF